jgi:hypothetical protein
MTVGNTIYEIKIAIHNNDLERFKNKLANVEELPFNLESIIISNHMNDFLLELFNQGKLSQKCRLMLGSLIDPKIRQIIQIEEL